MKLYVLRHGQTELNAKNLIVGRTDDALNDEGVSQAKTVAQKIATFAPNDAVGCIISSPLSRARQTAQFVADKIYEVTFRKITIIFDDRLIEQNYGEFEGKSRLSKEFIDSKGQFALSTGKTGESHLKLAQRVYNFLDELKANNEIKDKNVLLVTHGGVCRVINTYFYEMTNSEYSSFRLLNCALKEYDL